MADLISRQDAIEAICSVCGNDCDKTEFVYNAPQWEQVIICPEHYALSTLPSEQPELRWIPCSEKLPEKSGYYLCTMTEEHAQHPTGLEICEYDEYIEEFGFWYERFDKTSLGSLGSEWEELYVLAWTTLPDAYERVEE